MFPNDSKDVEHLRLHNMLAAGTDNAPSAQEDFEQNDGTTDDIFDYLQSQYIAGRYQEAVAEMEKASNRSSNPTAKTNISISAVLAPASEGGEAIPYLLHCQPIQNSGVSKNIMEGGSLSPFPQSTGATLETEAEDPMYTLASKYAGQPNSQSGRPSCHIPSMLAPLIYSPDGEPRATLFRQEERKEEAGGVALDYSNNCSNLDLGFIGTETEEEEDDSPNISCPSSPLSNYGSDQGEEDIEIIVFSGRGESAKALIDTSKIPTRSEALADTYKEVFDSENNPFSELTDVEETSQENYHAFLSLRGGGGDDDDATFGLDDDDDEFSAISSTASDAVSEAEDAESEDEETIVDEDDSAESDEKPPRSARNRELRRPTPKPEPPSLHPNSEKKYGRPTPLDPTKGAGAQPSRKKLRAEASRALDQERASDASRWLGAFHIPTSPEEKLKKKMLRDRDTPKPKEERRKKKPHKGKHREVSDRFNKIEEDDEDERDLEPSLSLRGGGDDNVALGPDDDDDSEHSSNEDAEVEIVSTKPKHAYAEDEVDDDDTAAINALRTNFKHIIRDPAEETDTEILKQAAKARQAPAKDAQKPMPESTPAKPLKTPPQPPRLPPTPRRVPNPPLRRTPASHSFHRPTPQPPLKPRNLDDDKFTKPALKRATPLVSISQTSSRPATHPRPVLPQTFRTSPRPARTTPTLAECVVPGIWDLDGEDERLGLKRAGGVTVVVLVGELVEEVEEVEELFVG